MSGSDEDLADELEFLKQDQTEEERTFIKKKSKEKSSKKKSKILKGETSSDECPFSEPDSDSPKKKRGRPRKSESPEASPKKTPKKSPKKKEKKVSPKKEPKAKTPPEKEKSPKKEVKKEVEKQSPVRKNVVDLKKAPNTLAGSYDPTKSNYHAINDACWKEGDPVPYQALARALQCCEDDSGRLAKTEYLSNFFRSGKVLTAWYFLRIVMSYSQP